MSLSIRIQEFLSVRRRAADLRMLKDLVVPSRDVRLLDVGGGAGAATERFAAGCREIVVLEPDPRKVALGRRLRPAIRFDEGRAETIPFPDHSFDRVVAVTAFHHLEDQDRSLTEMRRVLRDSGRIVLLELPPARAPGRLARWIGGFRHAGHMSFLEPEALKAKLE
ncbi:MAG: class I SAM-dependent methyltransferase, partial [Methanobacteriota archaeon]